MSTYPVGYTILNTQDLSRGRPVIIDVWYPAIQTARETPHDYGLGRGHVAERAPPVAGRLRPVIVLSHGAFGSSRNYSWIGEYLPGTGLSSPVFPTLRNLPSTARRRSILHPPFSLGSGRRTAPSRSIIFSASRNFRRSQILCGSVHWGILPGARLQLRSVEQSLTLVQCSSIADQIPRKGTGDVYTPGVLNRASRESLPDKPPVVINGSGSSWRSTLRWARAMTPPRSLQCPYQSTLSEQCKMISCHSNITQAGTRALSREHR